MIRLKLVFKCDHCGETDRFQTHFDEGMIEVTCLNCRITEPMMSYHIVDENFEFEDDDSDWDYDGEDGPPELEQEDEVSFHEDWYEELTLMGEEPTPPENDPEYDYDGPPLDEPDFDEHYDNDDEFCYL